MARRMLHTSIWQNEDFAKLSDKAKILYIGMISLADDDGRLKANSLLLRAQVFPLDPLVTVDEVRKWTNEIVRVKLVIHYEIDAQHFVQHPNWTKFQTLRADRKKESALPSPNDYWQPDDNQVSTKRPHKIREDKISKDKYPRKRGGSSKQKKLEDKTPMDLKEYVKWMKSSPLRHIQIIGEWAEAEGPKFTTKGEWESFTARNVRVAQTLTPYTTAQIEKAYHLMLKDVKHEVSGKTVGFISKYSLNTVSKYIDQI